MTALDPPAVVAPQSAAASNAGAGRVLAISTIGFTLLFAVWLMFGVLAIPIRAEFHLTTSQFTWLTAIAVLNGAIWRLPFGILADRFGGRLVSSFLLLATAIPAFLIPSAHSFASLLIYAFLVGLAGNSFTSGIAWNSVWFPKNRQGFALGVFGAGNVGASVTKLIGPAMIIIVPAAGIQFLGITIPGGWRFIPFFYGVLLVIMAAVTFLFTPTDRRPGQGRTLRNLLTPLSSIRVWRFSFYYLIVFGAYVALSVWLPHYFKDVYDLPLATAALLTALFIFPASLLRPLGGYLSDRFGPRRVMYIVFTLITLATLTLSIPDFSLTLSSTGKHFAFHLSVVPFSALLFLVGIGMGVGKAAVYKYIPEYFPKDIGAVGGLVGALGALGGFFLPLLFGCFESLTAIPQMTFLVLAVFAASAFIWLHITVLRITRAAAPQIRNRFELKPATT